MFSKFIFLSILSFSLITVASAKTTKEINRNPASSDEELEKRVERLEKLLLVGNSVDALRQYLAPKNISFKFSTRDYKEEEIQGILTMLKACISDVEITYPNNIIDINKIYFSYDREPRVEYARSENNYLSLYISPSGSDSHFPSAKQCKDKIVSEALINRK